MYIRADCHSAERMPDDLFTLTEAAARARVSARHLDRLIAAGSGPRVTTIGLRRLITAEHLQSWIEANTVAAGGEQT